MPEYVLPLEPPLPESHREELERRLFYVSPEIEGFVVEPQERMLRQVSVVTAGPVDHAVLGRKLNEMADSEVRTLRLAGRDAVWRSPHESPDVDGVFDELVAAEVLFTMGPGAVAAGSRFTDVLDAVDRRLAAIATGLFGAVTYQYPTLIATEALNRGGYLAAFPQFLLAPCRLREDAEVYRDFLDQLSGADSGSDFTSDVGSRLMQFAEHSGYCLPPTMCYHTYHQFAGRTLDRVPAVVTSRGKSFRNESRYHRSLERLWDFTIRETVFFGDADTVDARRREFMTAACELVGELGLAGYAAAASDPFFAGAQTRENVLAQRLLKLKYELNLPVEGGRSVAVGSFNLHGTRFGESFAITQMDGSPVHTGCVGFGLERFTLALFCRYGADPAAWPRNVFSALAL